MSSLSQDTVHATINALCPFTCPCRDAVAALSTKFSTAALDKHPQSKERGITLDLGFSCFILPMPRHLKAQLLQTQLQFTLVDCPGHASLIRTIMGGAQIIDMIILVVDVTKGIQTQTAECLVVAEVSSGRECQEALRAMASKQRQQPSDCHSPQTCLSADNMITKVLWRADPLRGTGPADCESHACQSVPCARYIRV